MGEREAIALALRYTEGVSRFILRFRGGSEASPQDIERICSVPNLQVIDRVSQKMLLVEAAEDELRATIDAMSGWVMVPEQMIRMPDPRVKVK